MVEPVNVVSATIVPCSKLIVLQVGEKKRFWNWSFSLGCGIALMMMMAHLKQWLVMVLDSCVSVSVGI